MRIKTAFTKKDIVIVLVFLIFLVINAGAISSGGRRRAKRILCLTNLKQLTLAWTDYAGDNDGFIVNGAPLGFTACQANPGTGEHAGEIPWVGRDWSNMTGEQLRACQENAIRDGALWPYCQGLKLYYCPSGYQGSIRSYGIVDGMNGMSRSGEGTIAGVHWIKNMTQILNPSERLVFIDEGWVTPDSYAVHFNRELWWEDPPFRHGNGTSVSFADGHSEWHRWKGDHVLPATIDDFYDLYWIQIGCWGELGYTPTY
jgi:prepilin-type processing-associated H-X9-DG protein